MSSPLLELKGVSRTYTAGGEPLTVLREVNLAIQNGEFVAIMGPSGSGKSTLMNIIGCLDKPTSGSYSIRGIEVATLNGDALAALRGDDMDNSVWLPYTTAGARVFGQRFFNDIVVRVKPDADMSVVQTDLHALLMKRHRKEDFNIRNQADTIATANQTQNTLTYLLAAIAVISLIVGGIGVMNIMLVSVTERTREIGIRMAIGARSFDVLFQFLTEAVMVCLIGGLAGVVVGVGGGLATSALLGWRVIFTVTPIVIAFACAFVTGILFGYLPARKAAHLDPIEALARD